MTKDRDEKESRLYDTRVIERNIQKGLVSRKDYEKYLKSLADMKDKARTPDDEASRG